MTTIAFYEARTRLSELLDQVEKGHKILITRHGKPAAVLMPPEEGRKDIRQVIAELKAYSKRQGRTLGGASARELVEAGRRF
jgi:prevent-host-death family protein